MSDEQDRTEEAANPSPCEQAPATEGKKKRKLTLDVEEADVSEVLERKISA